MALLAQTLWDRLPPAWATSHGHEVSAPYRRIRAAA